MATVAPVMNPTRKAITTLKITVSFFMLMFSLPKILPYRGGLRKWWSGLDGTCPGMLMDLRS
jgi:hypothetical protein